MKALQIDEIKGAWIEKVHRESLAGDQRRSGRCGDNLFIDEEGRVERQLILAAETFEGRVVDAVSAANDGLTL
jgi:hypothetical protein